MRDNIFILQIITWGFNLIKWRLLGLKIENFKKPPLIYQFVRIRKPQNIKLGVHTVLYPYTYLKSCDGNITIGNHTSIGEYTYINSMQNVIIGDNVLIAPSCHITDANHVYHNKHELIKKQGRIAKPVIIEDDVWIGAGVKILSGVRIGKGSVIAAGAVVTKDISDYSVVVGVPAKKIGQRS